MEAVKPGDLRAPEKRTGRAGTLQAAGIAGIRALLVHTISDAAKRFYEAYGFIASPVDPMTVRITLLEAERIILNPKRSQ
jgi:hypothetical protein